MVVFLSTPVVSQFRACELLLASFRRREEGQSLMRTRGEMASSRRDVRRAEAVDQGDREIAEGGHHLWGIARAQAGAVLPKADIAHIMEAILYAPMPTIELQQALWTGLGRREGGDEIDHL